MGDSNHKFNITGGSNDSAAKNEPSFASSLETAMNNGGDAVFNWFSESQGALKRINEIIATGGDTVWLSGTDNNTGFPTWYIVEGNHMFVLGAYFTDDGKTQLVDGTSSIDDFREIGFAYMLLILNNKMSNETISQIATYTLEYAGEGVPEIEVGEGLKNVIEQTVDVLKSFWEELIRLSWEGAGSIGSNVVQQQIEQRVAQAANSSQADGRAIAVEGGEIVADVGVSVSEVAIVVFGLGELAVSLALLLLEKKIVTYARIYNRSDINIDLSVCYVKEDSALVSAPMLPQNPVALPAISPSWTPPAILGSDAVHFIDMIFANTDTSKGVGYVLKAFANNDFPGFNVMVNIPSNDDNSLYVSFGENDQCYNYWETYKNQQTSITANTQSEGYTLKIATNQVNGKSPSPVDGQLGYYYEHLILFEKS